jgi:hypothetical protein
VAKTLASFFFLIYINVLFSIWISSVKVCFSNLKIMLN